MSAPADQRTILRYFRYLIVVAAASAALLVGSVYQRHAAEGRVQDRLAKFNLRTLTLVRDAAAAVGTLERTLEDGEATASVEERALPSSPQPAGALYSIGESLAAIAALQGEYGEARYSRTVDRAKARFGRVREAFEGAETALDAGNQLASLRLALYQLDRLHSIESDRALDALQSEGALRNRNLLLLGLAVLAATAVALWRLRALLKARLRQHAATREALLERERDLLQAQKMEALGTLVGGVAHDFNNLLTAILGNVELLQASLAEGAREAPELAEIRRAGERAAGLTRQLLVFSRKDVADTRVLDLALVLRDMEGLLRRLLRADIELALEIEDGLWPVEADQVQIEQVLINLVTNAKDAMPEGGSLTLSVGNVEVGEDGPRSASIPMGSFVRVRVADSGHGMLPDVRSRAFEPFFTTKESGKGTGLGLSTVHGIVTKSDGYIFVESESGRGTTIDVYLPRCADVRARPSAGEARGEDLRGSETVLLVEDDPQVRALVASGLASAGYAVIETPDPLEALRLCEGSEESIDLLLSDIVMPRMRGSELAQRVRSILPEIAVVFISGYSEDEVLERVRQSGHPLVAKPFKMQHLLAVLRQELDAPRRPRAEGNGGSRP